MPGEQFFARLCLAILLLLGGFDVFFGAIWPALQNAMVMFSR